MKTFKAASVSAVLALLSAYAIIGCPVPGPKPPTNDADANSEAGAEAGDNEDPSEDAAAAPSCVRACATLKSLGCPEGEKVDGGKTCYKLCADAEASGKFSLKPACVAGAKTLESLKLCGTVRCKK